MPPAAAAAAPLVGQGISAVLNHGAQGKVNDAITQILNGQAQDYGLGRNMLFGTGGTGGMSDIGQLQDASISDLNRQIQALYGGDNGGSFGQASDRVSQNYDPQNILKMLYGDSGADPYGQNTPGVQSALGQLTALLPQLAQNSGLASQNFQNGGATGQSQQGFDQLSQLMSQIQGNNSNGWATGAFGTNGMNDWMSAPLQSGAVSHQDPRNNPNLVDSTNAARAIIGAGGTNANMDAGMQAALGRIANGGNTSALSALSNTGLNVLGGNGLTPTGAQGESAALGVLNNGGATPTTQGLQATGLNLAQQPSLLPPQLAASLAHDQAARTYLDNIKSAQAQAVNRGNGAATGVGNGQQNAAMADYADKGSQIESKAMQDALLNQQSLQLQQAGMGANMANAGGTLENNRFGTAANTLTGLENVAANRFGLGGNFIGQANQGVNQNLQTGEQPIENLSNLSLDSILKSMGIMGQNESIGSNIAAQYANSGLQSGQLDLSKLGLANQVNQGNTGNLLTGQNLYNGQVNNQNTFGLQNGQLANSGSNDMSGVIQALLGGNLSAANQGLQRAGQFYNSTSQGANAQQNLLNFSGTQQNNGATETQNMINQLLAFTQHAGDAANETRMSNLPGIGLASKATSPYSQFIGPAIGIASGALQGLGGGGNNSGGGLGQNTGGLPGGNQGYWTP